MIVHFIRHAQAIKQTTELPDEHRFLTCRGRKRFRKISGALRKLDIAPEYIFSSPKIRAVQTADILAEKLSFSGEIIITPLLVDFTMASFHELLQRYPLSTELVLVGHDPDFSDLVGRLLNISPCFLSKGSVVTINISSITLTLSADIATMITGSGKVISNRGKAIARLQLDNLQSTKGETDDNT